MNLEERIKATVRDVPDFPKEGIVFKDITTLFKDAELIKGIHYEMVALCKNQNIGAVAGIESRGFLLGPAVAMTLGVPFIIIRKKGKLPYKTVAHKYDLEYGTAEIEMHIDAVESGQRVLIHDDLLATGGTACAAAELIKKQGGIVAGFNFFIELGFLEGRKNLKQFSENISTLVAY